MKMRARTWSLLTAGLALASLAGCGNDDGGPVLDAGVSADAGCTQPTFTSIYQTVLSSPRCIGCHGASGGLDFGGGKDAAYERLVGVASNNPGATARQRVTPNDPDQSWFYVKVADPSAPDGRMPLGGALSECEVMAIGGWIAGGALND
jgi:hypothetical protein